MLLGCCWDGSREGGRGRGCTVYKLLCVGMLCADKYLGHWLWWAGATRKVLTDGPRAFDLNINYMRTSRGVARLWPGTSSPLSPCLPGDNQRRRSHPKAPPNSTGMDRMERRERGQPIYFSLRTFKARVLFTVHHHRPHPTHPSTPYFSLLPSLAGPGERLAPSFNSLEHTRWCYGAALEPAGPTAGVLLTSVCEDPLNLPGRSRGGKTHPHPGVRALQLLMLYYWILTMNPPCLSACPSKGLSLICLSVCVSVASALYLHQVP